MTNCQPMSAGNALTMSTTGLYLSQYVKGRKISYRHYLIKTAANWKRWAFVLNMSFKHLAPVRYYL